MPRLLLNEDTTELIIELKTYNNSNDGYDMWSEVRIAIHNDYINFDRTSEFLYNTEVEYLKKWLEDIITGKNVEDKVLDFIEPELCFKVYLPYDERPGDEGSKLIFAKNGVYHHPLLLDIIIEFPSNGCYCGEQWTITLDEDEIKDFYIQLVNEMNDCLKSNKVLDYVDHIEMTAKHLEKNLGVTIPYDVMSKLNDLVNTEEFNNKIDLMINQEKILCAKAKYSRFSKVYTFLVDEKLDDVDWIVEDSLKEVKVIDFVELTIDELPVDYSQMKKIIPKPKQEDSEDIELRYIDCASGWSRFSGYSYYKNGNVINVEKINDNEYHAMVKGSDDNIYNVVYYPNNQKRSTCDCPRANGMPVVCKHKVAVYCYLNPNEDLNKLWLSDFYKNNPTDKIWWIDNLDYVGEYLFSFDKVKIYNLFYDYPHNLTLEEKELFDKENPEWKEFFKDRT